MKYFCNECGFRFSSDRKLVDVECPSCYSTCVYRDTAAEAREAAQKAEAAKQQEEKGK